MQFWLSKSRSNWFLQLTSTEQWGYSFLLMETTFDGVQTHTWLGFTDNESDPLTTVFLLYATGYLFVCRSICTFSYQLKIWSNTNITTWISYVLFYVQEPLRTMSNANFLKFYQVPKQYRTLKHCFLDCRTDGNFFHCNLTVLIYPITTITMLINWQVSDKSRARQLSKSQFVLFIRGKNKNSSAPRFPPPPLLSLSLVSNIFPAMWLDFPVFPPSRQEQCSTGLKVFSWPALKINALQVSKFSLDLHSKSLVRAKGQVELLCPEK